MKKMRPLLLFLCLLCTLTGFTQSRPRFPDGSYSANCTACRMSIENRPKEILFGIIIKDNGDVLFTISDKNWLPKLLNTEQDGIIVDLVSKDQYSCDKPAPGINEYGKGIFLNPVYRSAAVGKMIATGDGEVYIPIGKVPPQLKGKELEGNLGFVHGQQVCWYTYFADIPRARWDILPMGLYTDTLVNYITPGENDTTGSYFYTKDLQFTVPFERGKAAFNKADLQPLYDSLDLAKYNIQRMDIRAYSSVEGSASVNTALQRRRATSMIKALQQYQQVGMDTHVSCSDNWVEFRRDIAAAGYTDLTGLTNDEIRGRLLDKELTEKLEPLLSRHRKAIVTVWLTAKSRYERLLHTELVTQFNNAVTQKDIPAAITLQRTLFEQVAAGKAPDAYLDKLEIPTEQTYDELLNNREIYNLLLNRYDGRTAIQNLYNILKISPDNGRVHYNICALSLKLWQTDTGFVRADTLMNHIQRLPGMNIPSSLIKRMLINYYIILSDLDMQRDDFKAKDSSLAYIKDNYQGIHLNDKDLLALAKYLCYYQLCDWSETLLAPRMTSIDVDEDLLFYYVNLRMRHPGRIDGLAEQAIKNAMAINPRRFCRYFNPIGKGGITFQLLDNDKLRSLYCNTCNMKTIVSK